MSIQIYCGKKNFDTQKAERFFKERRIPVQMLDLKKHPLGEREVRLMIQQIGLDRLMDREQEAPWLLRTPIVRNGSRMTAGYCPEVWEQWIGE